MVSENKQVKEPIPVRVCFFKVGALQFISHLDLSRTMNHAIIRAGIPIHFSEGFNPHPKMVFSLPLSIGVESKREYLDFKMDGEMSFDEMKERLNAQLPPLMQITKVAPPVHKLREIAWAGYEWKVRLPGGNAALAEKLDTLYHTSPLIILKKSKSGEKETDISSMMRAMAVRYLPQEDRLLIHGKLAADNANFLNPEYLMRSAERYLGLDFSDPMSAGYDIRRLEVYLSDGTTVFE